MTEEEKLQQKAYRQLMTFLAECNITETANKKIVEIGFKNGYFIRETVTILIFHDKIFGSNRVIFLL